MSTVKVARLANLWLLSFAMGFVADGLWAAFLFLGVVTFIMSWILLFEEEETHE